MLERERERERERKSKREMMGLQSYMKEAAPFAAMIFIETGEVGMTTLTKAAMNKGMSNFVYVVYYNALGVLILFPYFLFQKHRYPYNLILY